MPADGITESRRVRLDDEPLSEGDLIDAQPHEVRPRQRRRPVRLLLFLLLPVVLIAGAVWYVTGGQVMSTDDAYVDADKVGVATDVSGFVREVDVKDNQHVEAGQPLFRLGGQSFRFALASAQAQLGITRDSLLALQASYGDMQTQIKQAQEDLAYNQREYNRQEFLGSQHVASDETLDAARHGLQNAQQKVASLEQQLAGIAANLNGDPTGPVEQNPRYLEAVAERDEAQRNLNDTYVTAPFAGIVTNVPSIAPGKYLPASTTAFYLVSTDHVWITAEPKETELTYVREGQPATVTVDAYPNQTWHGTVASISPAAAEEFSLLPAENTSGNWVKVVERVPMRVLVDTTGMNLPQLRSGMSVEVNVNTGHPRGLPHFLAALFGQARGQGGQ